jgi:hypothetical protein
LPARGIIDCTEPLPKLLVPIIIALEWSFKAPATISLAEADPLLIKTTKGWPLIRSPFFANTLDVSSSFLPCVETISPWLRNASATDIDWFKRPPGLFLKSKIKPWNLFPIFFLISVIAFSRPEVVVSEKVVKRT